MGDREILLQENNGVYSYLFTPPLTGTEFHFSANGVNSRSYRLNVLSTPRMQDFELVLTYPPYTRKTEEILKSTGNGTVPEGTRVAWRIGTTNTTDVVLTSKDTSLVFAKKDGYFSQDLQVFSQLDYTISTSNKEVKEYEKLEYSISVTKDAYPTLKIEQLRDSINPNISYYQGEATDDYGLSQIKLIFYPTDDEQEVQTLELSRPEQNYSSFYYTFPSGLEIRPGKAYSYYFEAADNDGITGSKITKSRIFNSQQLSANELAYRNIDAKKPLLYKLDKSLEKFKQQQKDLQQLNQSQKEKANLSFSDQTRIKDFLRKQGQQEELMKKFQKELKENLESEGKDDKQNRLLQERLERQEMEARKNEKLLEELNRLAEKINKEELARQLEELGKKQKNSQRNLEQLLELTKRYYIQEKANQLAFKLENLGKEQDELSQSPIEKEVSKKEQEAINHRFEEISKELEEFKKDNLRLKKPMKLSLDQEKENRIKEDQKEAIAAIDKHRESEEIPSKTEEGKQAADRAKSKQRSAARQMKEMGKSLGMSAAGSESSSMEEDAGVLRQLLDNLVIFSFKQENLYTSLSDVKVDVTLSGNMVKNQQELRELFTHIDDGLFALSLRQAELSEFVNEQITEVFYNLDKTLESLAETQYYQGVSYQKYVLTAANSLADFLANTLDNMQQQMNMEPGPGKGNDFQLPDIIMGQKQLQEKLEQQALGGPKNGNKEEDEKKNEQGEPKQGENGENGSGKQNNKL
ncbi:MAG TPA: hypothetical protein VLZ54_02700, partial [Arenibacter sp.]|nr:hypothetical protein [Arenibacter sp.]